MMDPLVLLGLNPKTTLLVTVVLVLIPLLILKWLYVPPDRPEGIS